MPIQAELIGAGGVLLALLVLLGALAGAASARLFLDASRSDDRDRRPAPRDSAASARKDPSTDAGRVRAKDSG